MAKGIEIGVGVDSRAAKRGLETGLIEPLEDVDKALEDLGKNKGGDKLEESLEGAQKATENLKKETKETADTIESEYRDSYRKMKQASDDGMDGAKEGMEDFKSESKQSARESAASFSGEFSDVGDMIQEVAANAFSGFGPAGAIAGIAAAVGIGYITQALEGAGDDTEAVKEKTKELAQAYIDGGTDASAGLEFLIDQLKTMATETDDGKQNLRDLKKMADNAGESFEDLAKATGVSTDELRDMWRESKKQETALQDAATAETDWTGAMTEGNAALQAKANLQADVTRYIGEQIGISEDAAEAARLYAEAGGPELEIKAQLLDGIASAHDGVRDAAIDAATSEEGALDIQKWITYVEEHKVQVEAFKTNLSLMSLSPEEWANYLELPESAQQSIAASWATGDTALREQISTTLSDGAGSAGSDAAVSFNESFKPKTDVDVTVTTDPAPAKAAIEGVAGAAYEAKIKVTSNNKAVTKKAIDDVAKARTATITASVDTGAATRALDSFTSKYRSTTVVVKTVDRNGKAVVV